MHTHGFPVHCYGGGQDGPVGLVSINALVVIGWPTPPIRTTHKPGCGKHQTAFPNVYEVKALSPHRRFVIALLSPRKSLKPDCTCSLRRKELQDLPTGFDGTLSLVHFKGKSCGIAALSSDY